MLRLKSLRISKGLSQADVARELNISRQAYNNYELGKRQADYETLLRLAEFFDTTIEQLISDSSQYDDTKKLTSADDSRSELYDDLNKLSDSELSKVEGFVKGLLAQGDSDK